MGSSGLAQPSLMRGCRNVGSSHRTDFQALFLQPTEGLRSLFLHLKGSAFSVATPSLHQLPGKKRTCSPPWGRSVETGTTEHQNASCTLSLFQNIAAELRPGPLWPESVGERKTPAILLCLLKLSDLFWANWQGMSLRPGRREKNLTCNHLPGRDVCHPNNGCRKTNIVFYFRVFI